MPGKYVAIDLKSFYASAECAARGLDPLTTNLVVADEDRTDKTICLAVSPSLKAYGIPGRPRLFEVRQMLRRFRAPDGKEIEFLIAPPRMQYYIEISSKIYSIYLKYVSADDIHVYSIDEVFIDAAPYAETYRNADGSIMTARQLAETMIKDVLAQTGITATAGIGTNLYLAKIAMDMVAKHTEPDADGVRIAELDEKRYREQLWDHRPLTSFWRIGEGIAKRLEANGMYTMGDVARTSLHNEKLLFWLFGVDAELLIDHAWGIEPCTMKDIKQYKPSSNSIGSGQVMSKPYSKEMGRIIIREMADDLVLELVEKGLAADQAVLHISYDKNSETAGGPVKLDRYGRKVPKSAHGSIRLENHTSSTEEITEAVLMLYDEIVSPKYLLRRFYITLCNVIPESDISPCYQFSLFTDPAETEQKQKKREQCWTLKKNMGKTQF